MQQMTFLPFLGFVRPVRFTSFGKFGLAAATSSLCTSRINLWFSQFLFQIQAASMTFSMIFLACNFACFRLLTGEPCVHRPTRYAKIRIPVWRIVCFVFFVFDVCSCKDKFIWCKQIDVSWFFSYSPQVQLSQQKRLQVPEPLLRKQTTCVCSALTLTHTEVDGLVREIWTREEKPQKKRKLSCLPIRLQQKNNLEPLMIFLSLTKISHNCFNGTIVLRFL